MKGCLGSDTVQVFYYICSGIEEEQKEVIAMRIYPNPSSGLVNLEWNSLKIHQSRVWVSDMTGRIVVAPITANTDLPLQFDMSNFDAGTYFVNSEVNGEMKTFPLVLR